MHRIHKAVYKGKEYEPYDVYDGMATLWSEDRADLDNGFYIDRLMEKYGVDVEKRLEEDGFYCIKRVSTSELSSLIETTFHYIYKGVELEKVGCHRDKNGKYMHILGQHFNANAPEKDIRYKDLYKKYLADGFTKEFVEKACCYMCKNIYDDDPNLEIIKEVKKLV